MVLIPDQQWERIQRDVDTCSVCLPDDAFKSYEYHPARPKYPRHTGRILFLSEAPPQSGGFWTESRADDLRIKLMQLLGISPRGNTPQVIASFMEKGYFLLQALKWPLKKSFNHFGPVQQRKLVEHSASAHLNNEIQALKPRAILAMGKAAWMSCLLMSTSSSCRFDQGFEGNLNEKQTITLQGHVILWRATYLPVDQNLRIPNRADQIQGHIQSFLAECTQLRSV